MRVRRKFLQLTNYTYPYGTEGFLKSYLPKGYKTDQHGNYYLLIGDKPSTMFTCHLDTACSKQEKVRHVQSGNIIKTDGKTILGADDKAGMTVILYMIEKKVPGLYYFFIGEEVGCIGSGLVADFWDSSEFRHHIKKCVSFDRRGTKSVITHQFVGRCCSDEFGQDLANKLNSFGNLMLHLDDTGVVTDSAKFVTLIPECTNISVGYYNEHTTRESQNIEYLSNLCKAVCSIDWESLPVVRNVDDVDFEFDDEDDDFSDLDFTSSNYSYFNIKGSTRKMYISDEQIDKERVLIEDWLINRSSYFDTKTFIWNGNELQIETTYGQVQFVGHRYDLVKFIPQIEEVELKHLSESFWKKKLVL